MMTGFKFHNNIDAMLWLDASAERDALYLQAFELAKLRVESALNGAADPEKFCVFTDCDETIIDNSAYNAWLIESGCNYHDDTWNRYCKRKISGAKPGAVEFAQFLSDRGVRLFYVTSRLEEIRSSTAENLGALGFPVTQADGNSSPDSAADWSLFLKGAVIDGEARKDKFWQYEWIQGTHGVKPILWLGDNLGDFEFRYKVKSGGDQVSRRQSALGVDKSRWGQDWIVMPNPTYGDWLRTLKDEAGNVVYDDDKGGLYQPEPVREPVTAKEAPKMHLLEIWDGKDL